MQSLIVFCRCQAVGPAIDEKEDTETYDIGQVVAKRVLHFKRCLRANVEGNCTLFFLLIYK